MKRLFRGPAPQCLARFRPGTDAWDGQKVDEAKPLIWQALTAMQGELCAYCEGSLVDLGRHIEHFCQRSVYPNRTFDWDNLFGACDRRDSCGHYKDRPRAPDYDCGDLVNPAVEDPDQFFIIRDTGRIEPRPGLSARHRVRAELTIRVFNLNLDNDHGGRSLCAERRRQLNHYTKREPDILSFLSDLPPHERDTYLEVELQHALATPFGSIIRHFLQQAA